MKTDTIEQLLMRAVNDHATAYAIVWLEDGKVVTAGELGDSTINAVTLVGGLEQLKGQILKQISWEEVNS